MIVTFDENNKDFLNDLSCAAVINTLEEIEKIITTIKGKKYKSYKNLARDIKNMIDVLDPIDRKRTIECILENIHPEQRSLLDPVHVILQSSKPKRCQCLTFL